MLNVQVERETSAPPELVLDTLREPSPERRAEIWSNITPKHSTLHDSGPDFLELTEGTFIAGVFWERSRYEWAQPGAVVSTVRSPMCSNPAAGSSSGPHRARVAAVGSSSCFNASSSPG